MPCRKFKLFSIGPSSTIYDCCSMLRHIQFGLGFSGLRQHRKHGQYYYNWKTITSSLLIVGCILTTLCWSFYIKSQNPQIIDLDSLIKSIIYLELTMSMFMYLVTSASMLLNVQTHMCLYESLHKLDKILIEEFRCNLHYEKLKRKHICLLYGMGLYYGIVITSAALNSFKGNDIFLDLLLGMLYAFITGGTHANGYVLMNLAEILKIRFRLIHKLLVLHKNAENADCLSRLVQLLKDYHDCIRAINKVYSASLIISFLHDFTLTTSELYLVFGGTLKGIKVVLYITLCMLLPLYKITIAPVYCELAVKELHNCFKIIKDLDFFWPNNAKIKKMVNSFLLWRCENKLEFQCGTTALNKKIITGIYSQLVNYLLVLIQFRMTQEMGHEIANQKHSIQDWIGVADFFNNNSTTTLLEDL